LTSVWQVLSESLDKHVVYHLVTQLEVIPWVKMAVQRVGEPEGPTSEEYEVSELELNWCAAATFDLEIDP
jgi:hypothetical protein